MEQQYFHLSKVSGNTKTGAIAVGTGSKNTCPECPFKNNGCYASSSFLKFHWAKVSSGERGTDWGGFVKDVATLPIGSKFRLSQAGDLPSSNGKHIDGPKVQALADVVKKNKLISWTYTHFKYQKGNNLKTIRAAIKKGLVINISCNNVSEVDKARSLGLPATVVVPHDAPDTMVTEGGNKIIACPAQVNKTGKKITCETCLLCQKGQRSVTVAFKSHGLLKKKVSAIVSK